MRAESIRGVTTGAAGISSGDTVRVATVGCRGSLAQSFQLGLGNALLGFRQLAALARHNPIQDVAHSGWSSHD